MDKINPFVYQECADIVRCCADEYRDIKNKLNKISSLLTDMNYSANDTLLCKIERDSIELHKMLDSMHDYENELRRAADALISCPMDFHLAFDIKSWWEHAYPVIAQIATVTGAITGVAAITVTPITFIKWIRSKLQEKQIKEEYEWIKLILNEDKWSICFLSQKLDLTDDETKRILKGFGYKWDAKKMLYIATEYTFELRKIKVIDLH